MGTLSTRTTAIWPPPIRKGLLDDASKNPFEERVASYFLGMFKVTLFEETSTAAHSSLGMSRWSATDETKRE